MAESGLIQIRCKKSLEWDSAFHKGDLFISAVFQMVQRNVVGTPREGASSNE